MKEIIEKGIKVVFVVAVSFVSWFVFTDEPVKKVKKIETQKEIDVLQEVVEPVEQVEPIEPINNVNKCVEHVIARGDTFYNYTKVKFSEEKLFYNERPLAVTDMIAGNIISVCNGEK